MESGRVGSRLTGRPRKGKNKQLKNQMLSNCKEGGGVIPISVFAG
nr:MAG TPA: hypothetical protein [Caudoviricetes sp.]